MHTIKTRFNPTSTAVVVGLLALLALLALAAAPARAADGPSRPLALISSAVETASSESGTIAVLSKNVAGGGANSNAFTNVYLVTLDGRRKAVFRERLEASTRRAGDYGNGIEIGKPANGDQLDRWRVPRPDYSPNGRNLAFVSEGLNAKGYDTALHTVRTTGTGRSLVTAAFEDPGLPQWTLRP